MLTDCKVKLIQTGHNQNCSRIPDCAETSTLNDHNSQIITDNKVILAALERYEVYLFPEKFDEHCTNRFRDVPDLLQTAPEKQQKTETGYDPKPLFIHVLT